jgi:hypothetical protein
MIPKFKLEATEVSPAATVDSTAPLHMAHWAFDTVLKKTSKQLVKITALTLFIMLQS